MTLLFPRLPRAQALLLAKERAALSLAELRDLASESHPAAYYAPTGGTRVPEAELSTLAASVRELARECGYPDPCSGSARNQVDGKLGKLMHEGWRLTPSEACRDEVWNFMGCVLLPDFVRWRFPGEATASKNFLGQDRGIDNALGRCWWAAEVLRDDDSPDDPYDLLVNLGVDETVGFTRRSRAVVHRRVAVTLARMVMRIYESGFPVARHDLMRDAMKRFLRLAPIVSFESLSSRELELAMWELVDASARHMARARGFEYTSPERPEPPPPTLTLASATAPDAREHVAANTDSSQGLSGLLADIDVGSKSPSRFTTVKEWLAELFDTDPEQVSVKWLHDAKNYRNRIGESLRHHPVVALLLCLADGEKIIEAVDSRIHLSPRSTVLVCESPKAVDDWAVSTIIVTRELAEAPRAAQLFPEARVVTVEPPAAEPVELDAEDRQRLVEELDELPLGQVNAVAAVESAVHRVLRVVTRTKRIIDQKNVGNRISEGLGTKDSLLVLGVASELLDSAVDKTREQLRELEPGRVVVLAAEDEEGCLAHPPLVLYGMGPDDDSGDEDATVEQAPATPTPRRVSEPSEADADEPIEQPVSFLETESVEEQADLVAQYLLFHGPLAKEEAIRLAAESMRTDGRLEYQRLRTNGRIYTAILSAIEMGVRTGYFDRPRRGEIRATLTSTEDFSKDDWIRAVVHALDPGEPIARDFAVRTVAAWARENLGLDYMRIRRNGRIDRGVRNAIRTLIRRDLMKATGRDEIVLLEDAD